MRVLIRTIDKSHDRSIGQLDHTIEVNRLSIGRGTDQDILLADPRVALKHAVIVGQNNLFQIQSKAITGVIVNDHLCKVSVLNAGDQINIGDNLLTVLNADDFSVDLALSIESVKSDEAVSLTEERFKTSLKRSRILNKRTASWTFFISLLIVTLVIPLASVINPESKQAIGQVSLLDDSSWLTGELHQVHTFMGNQCENCHQKPFERVTNQACTSCHEEIKQHVDAQHELPELNQQRCAFCHREHEDTATLVRQDEENCAQCHSHITTKISNPSIDNAANFGTNHPDFKLSLLRPKQQQEQLVWDTERQLISTPNLKEINYLKFSHQQHLVEGGVQNATGADQILECNSCHQSQLDGGIMQPITMERHCSSCHRMEFDPTNPKRQIPHGDPELLLVTLKEYYSRQFLDGLTDQTSRAQQVRQVRRPGVSPTSSKSEIRQLALSWAETQTEAVAEDLIERRACVTCHQIEVDKAAELERRWHIRPIKISKQWLPKANFNHRKHETMKCTSCHKAELSESTEDILIPDIKNCRQCHSGQNDDSQLASTCVMCHGFHFTSQGTSE